MSNSESGELKESKQTGLLPADQSAEVAAKMQEEVLNVSSAKCTAALPPPEKEAEFSGKPAYGGFQILYRHLWKDLAKNYYDRDALAKFKDYEHKFDENISTLNDLDLALKKMAESLNDRYTFYTNSKELKEAFEESKTLKNAGLDLHKQADHFEVAGIVYKGPAYDTRLKERDTVKCINNIAIDSLSEKQVKKLLKGAEGKKVEISAVSKDSGDEYNLELKLADAQKPQVESKLLDDNLVYMRFPTFEESGKVENYGNLAEFVESFKKELDKSGNQINGLILDLRNNQGGDTEEAILFSSLFLEPGKTVTKLVPQGGMQERKAVTDDKLVFNGKQVDAQVLKVLKETPMVVLSNGSSASSAELTIGALKDNDRAEILGEQTFGKGVGFKIMMAQGGNLSVTNLKYLTPDNYDLNKKGIIPDLEIKSDYFKEGDEQLEQALIEIRKQKR